MRPLVQTNAITVLIGPFLDATDGVTPETGLDVTTFNCDLYKGATKSDLTITASGGNNDCVHVANGFYSLELTAANLDTLGELTVTVNVAGALPVWNGFTVMSYRSYAQLIWGAIYDRGGRVWHLAATGGSDSNPGTFEKSFATFTVAQLAADAGDVIAMRGTFGSTISFIKDGLILDGQGTAAIVVSSGSAIAMSGRKHATIRNFPTITTTASTGTGILAIGSSNVVVQDCPSINGEFDGVGFGSSNHVSIRRCGVVGTYDAANFGQCRGLRVEDSTFFTDGTYGSDVDYRGIIANEGATGIIVNCRIESTVSRASSAGQVIALLTDDESTGEHSSLLVVNTPLIARAQDDTMTGQVSGFSHQPGQSRPVHARLVNCPILTSHANSGGDEFTIDASVSGSLVELVACDVDETKFSGTDNIRVVKADHEGRLLANVDYFGGSAGTFTGGKPDVQAVAGSVAGSVGSVSGSVGSVVGHTPQSGDSYSRLGAPAGASLAADIAANPADVVAAMDADSTQLASIAGDASEAAGAAIEAAANSAANGTKLGTIENLGTGTTLAKNLRDIAGASFSVATDALESVRDRGDVAWVSGGGTPISSQYVDDDHTWRFERSSQMTAANVIREVVGFNALLAMDFELPMPEAVSISVIDSATSNNSTLTAGIGTPATDPDKQIAILPVDTTGVSAGTYTFTVTITTTDSQTFVRKGTLILEAAS